MEEIQVQVERLEAATNTLQAHVANGAKEDAVGTMAEVLRITADLAAAVNTWAGVPTASENAAEGEVIE